MKIPSGWESLILVLTPDVDPDITFAPSYVRVTRGISEMPNFFRTERISIEICSAPLPFDTS